MIGGKSQFSFRLENAYIGICFESTFELRRPNYIRFVSLNKTVLNVVLRVTINYFLLRLISH